MSVKLLNEHNLEFLSLKEGCTGVVIGAIWVHFFKPEKNLEFFRLKNEPIDGYPGKLE